MIPFAIPRNGEVVNLSNIVRMTVHPSGKCALCEEMHIVGQQSGVTVRFVDGTEEVYNGEASRILNAEIQFALNCWREFQIQSTSRIVPPSAGEKIM